MIERDSYYIEDGQFRRQVVEDIGKLLNLHLVALGNDGNMPPDPGGEPAQPRHPLLPPQLGRSALQLPETTTGSVAF